MIDLYKLSFIIKLTFQLFVFFSHSDSTPAPKSRPLPPTFANNDMKKTLALLVVPSTNTSLAKFGKSIVETWGKIAKTNKTLSVDIWFATGDDTLRKWGWPMVPGFENDSENSKVKKVQAEDSSTINKSHWEEEIRAIVDDVMARVKKEPIAIEDEVQTQFKMVTKVLNGFMHIDQIVNIIDM